MDDRKALAKRGTGALSKWNPYDEEAAEEEQKQLDEEGGPFMKIKVGRNVIRIPPPIGDMRSPFVVAHQHFINIPGAESAVSFVCPRLAKVGPCPACAKAEELVRSGNPQDAEYGRQLQPRRRVFCNVLNRKEPDKGMQILAFGKMIHEQLVALRRDPDAGGDFTDPDRGFDLVIERTGTGRDDTKYKVFAARKSSPFGDPDLILEQNDLLKLATPKPLEEIEAILGDTATAATGGRVGRGAATGGRRAPTAQRMVGRVVPEEEDEDGSAF